MLGAQPLVDKKELNVCFDLVCSWQAETSMWSMWFQVGYNFVSASITDWLTYYWPTQKQQIVSNKNDMPVYIVSDNW